jgi:anti-sigma factor RsiW
MSAGEIRRDHCAEDVAAYALGALEPVEADAFRRHLETCPVCPSELVSFTQVVDELAAGAPSLRAPRELRRRVLRAVEDEPRLDASARRERGRPRLRLPRPALAFSGAAAIAAAAVIVVLAVGSGTSTRTIDAQVTGHGQADVRLSSDHAQLVVHNFPAAPKGHIYEVWLKRGSTAQPTTALFGVTDSGDASVDIPGDLHGVTRVMVTTEPAGGTKVPTTPPVISAKLG